jgi:hypothetical protein
MEGERMIHSNNHARLGKCKSRRADREVVRQLNFAVDGRLEQVLTLVQAFDLLPVMIVSFTIMDSADGDIIRVLSSDSERAIEIFSLAKLSFSVNELLVVQLPNGPEPMLRVCLSLLGAKIRIHYSYALLVGAEEQAAVALYVDKIEDAASLLKREGFRLLSEQDMVC